MNDSEKDHLRTLIDSLPDSIYVKDTESRFLVANVAVARHMGAASPEELIGKTDHDYYPAELADRYLANEREILRTGHPMIGVEEPTIDHKTGEQQWKSTTKSPLYDENGKIVGLVGMGRDITEHRRVEDALARERKLLRALMDNMPDLIYVKDAESRFVLANAGTSRFMGLKSPNDLIGKTDFDFYPYEVAKKFYDDEQNCFKSDKPLINIEEPVVNLGTGEHQWLLTSKVPLRDNQGDLAGYVGINRDITKLKKAEAELARHKEHLEELVEERSAELREANEQLRLEIIEHQRVGEALLQARESERRFAEKLTILHSVGNELSKAESIGNLARRAVWLGYKQLGFPRLSLQFFDPDEQNVHGAFSISDAGLLLDEREEIETLDAAGGEKWREILEKKTGLIVRREEIGAGSTMIAPVYDGKEVIGAISTSDLTHPGLLTSQHGEILVLYANTVGHLYSLKRAEEELARHRDNLQDLVGERTADLIEANRALEDSIVRLGQAHEQLVESEKMAALGALVAGVAHEINTPVGVGVTAASFLEEETRQCAQLFAEQKLKSSGLSAYLKSAADSAAIILSNLRRAANHIQSFKQVAVDQSGQQRRVFNLKEYVDEVLLSLHPRIKKTNHLIHIECPEDITLDSFPGAFSQIITNLIMNSLAHGFHGIDVGHITMEFSRRDSALRFIYADDGHGIQREHLSKIFEPFFTTSRGQGGSGLGLHILYNLVTITLGGRVKCESEPEKGARFTMDIPLRADNGDVTLLDKKSKKG